LNSYLQSLDSRQTFARTATDLGVNLTIVHKKVSICLAAFPISHVAPSDYTAYALFFANGYLYSSTTSLTASYLSSLAWEHEQFASQRLFAFTLSSMPSPAPAFTASHSLDTL
jgi:hypothetical protein